MTDYMNIEKDAKEMLGKFPNKLDIEQFHLVFDQISNKINELVGHKLLTFTVIHPDDSHVIRLYSNKPNDYALEDTKPMKRDAWSIQVIDEMRPYKISTIEEMMPLFPDYQKIADLGLGAALNLPICYENKCIGTVNLLDVENSYKQVDFEEISKYGQLASNIFASYRQNNCH